jgi:hypothetical protein
MKALSGAAETERPPHPTEIKGHGESKKAATALQKNQHLPIKLKL